MSVVSFARTAGVTVERSKICSRIVTISDVLADMSMMSTSPWSDDLADLVSEIGERTIASVTSFAWRRNAKGHVGVFGVSDDEGAVG